MFKFIGTANTGILASFGKFKNIRKPGLSFYIPGVQQIHVVSNMLREQIYTFEVKTKDNVFANLVIAIQYRVKEENSATYYYSMDKPQEQMGSYIENIIRVTVPTITLDEFFESQNEISQNIIINVSNKMEQNGITIENTLIKNIDPDAEVKKSMNKINAAKRMRVVAIEEAETEYIKKVRESEADRDRKILQGQGIAGQRKAILDGYNDSVESMSTSLGVSAADIIQFVLKTQHLDMLEIIGKSTNAKTIFVDHNIQTDQVKLMGALECNTKN